MSITSVRSRPVFPSLDAFSWPGDITRISDEEWTRQPVGQFGLNYDDVDSYGWPTGPTGTSRGESMTSGL